MNGVALTMRSSRLRMAALGAITIAMVGCGSHFNPDAYPTPETLLSASKAAMDHGDCDGASRGFQRAILELPARDSAVADANFYLAECSFRKGNYLEASRQFRRVVDARPDHPLAPQALLRAGEALAKLWKNPSLDPSYGETAVATLTDLVARYPNSDAAKEAHAQIAAINDKLALKTLHNGEFYYRLHAYDSAIIYFRAVVAKYPNSTHAPDALLRLIRTYAKIGYTDEARETCAHLRRYYPNAPASDDCPARPSAP